MALFINVDVEAECDDFLVKDAYRTTGYGGWTWVEPEAAAMFLMSILNDVKFDTTPKEQREYLKWVHDIIEKLPTLLADLQGEEILSYVCDDFTVDVLIRDELAEEEYLVMGYVDNDVVIELDDAVAQMELLNSDIKKH